MFEKEKAIVEGLKAAREYCRSRDMKCLRKDEHGKSDECPFLLQFTGCSLNYIKPGVWSPEYTENLLEARSKWLK